MDTSARDDEPKDPIEKIVFDGLKANGIDFRHERQGGTRHLDFYLPACGIYIECKAYGTERVYKQMRRSPNVLVVQGRKAAEFLIRSLEYTRKL